jgi:hypothetical protein
VDLTFERGEPSAPRGHAIVFFRARHDPDVVLASYVVVPPVTIELSKYLPPMFAGHMPASDLRGSAIPLPPLPERVESLSLLRRLAEARHDDLVDGGSLDPSNLEEQLRAVVEAAQRYTVLYQRFIADLPESAPEPAPSVALPDVDDLLVSLLSEREKLGELARLTGKLRYAVEGSDRTLAAETIGEMERIARHLPAKYRLDAFIKAAQIPGQRGQRLSQLYLERSYRLCDENYEGIEEIEMEIRLLESDPSSA